MSELIGLPAGVIAKSAETRARRLIDRHWLDVETVAAALKEKLELSRDAVSNLFVARLDS